MKKKGKHLLKVYVLLAVILLPTMAGAMHIMEGYLPKVHSLIWSLISLPFVIYGAKSASKVTKEYPDKKLLLAMAGAFTFLLSSLKIPSVTGSCSHPTGIGFGAIIFGPGPMFIIGVIVLLFQALLLAHGGITTLGANTFSMAIVGSLVSYGLFKSLKKTGINEYVNVFIAVTLGNLATYATTALQLAIAFPAGNFAGELVKYLSIFALTQVPIAIVEGLLSTLIYERVKKYDGGGLLYENI